MEHAMTHEPFPGGIRRWRAAMGIITVTAQAGAETPAVPAPESVVSSQDNSIPAVTPPLPALLETLSGEARLNYIDAGFLYAARDWEGALTKYLQAYQITNDARLLWSAALCEKNKSHFAKAAAFMERYLAAGPPYVTPESRTKARAFVDAAKSLTGSVTIVCNEPGVSVNVDGESVGATPLRDAISVDPGHHEIAVQKTGYKGFRTGIVVEPGEEIRFAATPEKIVHEGLLVVRTEAGAQVFLDRRHVDSDAERTRVPSGTHALRVTAPGKRPFQSVIVIRDGETTFVTARLAKSPSTGTSTAVWFAIGTAILAGAAGSYVLLSH